MIKPKALTSLSIFFPCHNEYENLDSMLEQAVQIGERYGVDYEVLVVDDGSRDGSAEKVKAWGAKNPRIRLVRHEKNLGYGAALRSGYENVRKDLVFMTDGDGQFNLSDIDKLFSKIDGCDAVAGFRIDRQDKSLRRLNGILWTQLNRFLFGLRVRDIDCAFKLFRRKHLQDLQLESNQLLIHAEVLAKLKKKGCQIQEIGIPHYPRKAGEATATKPKAIFKTFAELFRLYRRIR